MNVPFDGRNPAQATAIPARRQVSEEGLFCGTGAVGSAWQEKCQTVSLYPTLCPPATTRPPVPPHPKAGPPGGTSRQLLGGSRRTPALPRPILEHREHIQEHRDRIQEDQQDKDHIQEHLEHSLERQQDQGRILPQDNHPVALDSGPLLRREDRLLR